jgi:long-chain acyl-CoA synthetase
MKEFKPSIGYLALHNKADVLPMFLEGTHDALPKGKLLPQRRRIAAHIGPALRHEALAAAVAHLPKGEQNREAARLVELAVRKLAPPGVNRVAPAREADGTAEDPEDKDREVTR